MTNLDSSWMNNVLNIIGVKLLKLGFTWCNHEHSLIVANVGNLAEYQNRLIFPYNQRLRCLPFAPDLI